MVGHSASFVPVDQSALSVLQSALWGSSGSPLPADEVINPNTDLGHCWPMLGSQGYVTVRLSEPVMVTSVSIDHVPLSVAMDMKSAPRHIKVWGTPYPQADGHGLHRRREQPGERSGQVLLGELDYVVSEAAEPVQTFHVRGVSHQKNEEVAFQVTSNHGKEDYTCLYRVRVHSSELDLE